MYGYGRHRRGGVPVQCRGPAPGTVCLLLDRYGPQSVRATLPTDASDTWVLEVIDPIEDTPGTTTARLLWPLPLGPDGVPRTGVGMVVRTADVVWVEGW